MNLKFEKWTGAGNDFILVDLRDPEAAKAFSVWQHSRSEFARTVCRRTQSVGADGLIFLTGAAGQVTWDFYNADGSEAEMCGNAARCVGSYELRRSGKKSANIATKAGLVSASFAGEARIAVAMTSISAIQERHQVRISESEALLSGAWINAGVPHFVLGLSEKGQLPRREYSERIRRHSSFGPDGVNVTYVVTSEPENYAVTYERGVEDYTQACGTGALAAAFFLNIQERTSDRARLVRMPGGLLEVSWLQGRTILTGPARQICMGHLTEEAL